MAVTWLTVFLLSATSLTFIPETWSLSLRGSADPSQDVETFLGTFGYFDADSDAYDVKQQIADAIANFQRTWGLEVTGEMDDATSALMEEPRCGDDDVEIVHRKNGTRTKRYDAVKAWSKCSLTYRIATYELEDRYTPDLTNQEVEDTIARAVKYWTDVVPGLSITEATSGGGDITLVFLSGCHGGFQCFYGPGMVLAHAFFPENGDVHFDEAETWVLHAPTASGEAELLRVAVHELGHSLGLGHSSVAGAVMRSNSASWSEELTQDDIDGITSLYNCDGTTTPGTTTPGTPSTTTASESDACVLQPCKNGGTCSSVGSEWSCTCPPGYTGKACYRKTSG